MIEYTYLIVGETEDCNDREHTEIYEITGTDEDLRTKVLKLYEDDHSFSLDRVYVIAGEIEENHFDHLVAEGKVHQKAGIDKRVAEYKERQLRKTEESERATLARLKAKYDV